VDSTNERALDVLTALRDVEALGTHALRETLDVDPSAMT
jgi:hypothetical protein